MELLNKRPDDMARITTKELADKFIAEQVAELRAQIGDKRCCWRCPAAWTPRLLRRF
jgi:hypothetical protein